MKTIRELYKILNCQDYRITFSPIEYNDEDLMIHCNNNFIGGFFEEKLCFIHTESLSELLEESESVYYGFSKKSGKHSMLVCPIEKAKEYLKVTYKERFEYQNFVLNISSYFKSNNRYNEHINQNYELYVIFLKFCNEKRLLKYKPLDKKDRILHMNYINNDLTKKGIKIFDELLDKWLVYTSRTGKIDNLKMLDKYYTKIESEIT